MSRECALVCERCAALLSSMKTPDQKDRFWQSATSRWPATTVEDLCREHGLKCLNLSPSRSARKSQLSTPLQQGSRSLREALEGLGLKILYEETLAGPSCRGSPEHHRLAGVDPESAEKLARAYRNQAALWSGTAREQRASLDEPPQRPGKLARALETIRQVRRSSVRVYAPVCGDE